MWFQLEAFYSLLGFSQLSLKVKEGNLPAPQICNICLTDNTAPLEIDHTSYSKTSTQRQADLRAEISKPPCIVLPGNTGSLCAASQQTNRDPAGGGSAWEISVTLTLERRPGGERTDGRTDGFSLYE